jgi:hypothetical protein
MRMLPALILALVLQEPDAKAVADAFKSLDGDDASARAAAFALLKGSADPALQTRLKKALGSSGASWLKKAHAERVRATRTLVIASRKGWNPKEVEAKQKELLDLLAKGDPKAMTAPVKAFWAKFFPDLAAADKDEKFAAAKARLDEIAARQEALGTAEKDGIRKTSQELLRGVDDAALLLILDKRDQKIMADNALLQDKVPAPEYAQARQTNLYRILMGKIPLRLDAKLCDAAREHSEDMVKHDFFDHMSPLPGKRTPSDRAAKHGTKAGGENIHFGSPTAEGSFWSWFHSLGHHQNMLRDYATIGVGNFQKHWTQMFG